MTTGGGSDATVRPTARLLVVDDRGRVLLFRVEDDSIWDPADPRGRDQPRSFWVLPGGGLEPGESFAQAALRELAEETGLTEVALGPGVLERDKLLRWNDADLLLRERYFLVRVAEPNVSTHGLDAAERAVYRDLRWWSLAELRATTEAVFPEELPAVLERALALP